MSTLNSIIASMRAAPENEGARAIVVLSGESDCNVLGCLAARVADVWRAVGAEIVLVDFARPDWNSQLQMALNADAQFVFTCDPDLLANGLTPGKNLRDLFTAPVVTYIPRHPAYYLDALLPPSPRLIAVTCDQTHQKFLKRLYARTAPELPAPTTGFFPHPGHPSPTATPDADDETNARPIPVLFAGSLADPRRARDNWQAYLPTTQAALLDQIAEHCVQNDDVVLDDILEAAMLRANVDIFDDIPNLIFCYKNLDAYVRNFRRLVILQTMIEAGAPIRIHCNNPQLLEVPAGYPATVNPPIDFERIPELCRQTRVALAIHPNMHGGLTEWVATAMINGAATVCDRHAWPAREFPDDRQAAYFPGAAPEKAVAASARLLRRDRRRASIAAAGQAHVRDHFSVRHLADFLSGAAWQRRHTG